MKTYKANNNTNTSIHRRVRKVHSKAKFVGVLYFFGELFMLALACLPMLTVNGTALWVTKCFDFFKATGDGKIVSIITAVLYLLVVLIAFINFLRALGKLGNLLRKNHTKVGRIKQNMQAMDDMGKLFSGTFAAIICFHFLIYIINAKDAVKLAGLDAVANGLPTIPLAYVTLGLGLLIHFLAGIVHGKVSNFQIGGQVAQIVEEKRENGVFVFFIRNLIQVVAVAAMVYFFAPFVVEEGKVNGVITDFSAAFKDIMGSVVPFALVIVTAIFMIVMIKHATAATEFNLYGMRGSGMKNFRVFAFLAFLTAGGLCAMPLISGGSFAVNAYVYVAAIAFVAFLLDCIIKPRKKNKKKKGEEEPTDEFFPMDPQAAETDNKGNREIAPQYPPMYPPYPPMYPPQQQPVVQRVVYPQAPQVIQQPQQPMYIPIYYPMPQSQNNNPCWVNRCPLQNNAPVCPAKPCETNEKPVEPQVEPKAVQALDKPMKDKKAARAKRKELRARKKEMKRAKAELKLANKIAKRNQKEELKLRKAELKSGNKLAKASKKNQIKLQKEDLKMRKKEDKLAKKQAVLTAVAPVDPVAPVEENVKLGVASVDEIVLPQVDPDEIAGERALNPDKQWKVRCPKCGKLLLVRGVSPYHRCPSCDKVFEIRKFETYTKKAKSNK